MLLLGAGSQPAPLLLPARCGSWQGSNRGKDTPRSRWEAAAAASICGIGAAYDSPYRQSLLAAYAVYKEKTRESLSR